MKVRKLNYEQLKAEKSKILSLMLKWQKTYKEFFDLNYAKASNLDLRYHWNESVSDMIEFLQKDIPEQDECRYATNGFAFFIAEDDDNEVLGIALGGGISTYRGFANQLFGISGTFFRIEEMVISVSAMLPRCFRIEEIVPHRRIGKELLKAVVNHVNTLEKQYPISVCPHYNNKNAHEFFEKNLFTLGCGSMGHSYALKIADFEHINKNIHKERIAGKNTFVIDDYKSPSII